MNNSIELTQVGRYDSGIFDEGAAEITAYDPHSEQLFVINGASSTIDILDISDPTNPVLSQAISIEEFGGGINSIAIKDGVVAAAIEGESAQDLGTIVFFDTEGNVLNQVTVGALPDMVTFTPDGTKVLVANEGEPDEDDPANNPEGSVSIIDISGGVANASVKAADFTAYNGQEETLREQGVRIFPGENLANDVEPEYIAVSPDGTQAFVTLQENNAVAIVDLETGEISDIQPLGLKDYSLEGNQIDANDEDGINIQNQPVFGLYQPDSIAAYEVNGATYYVTANEGDARNEDDRIEDLELDPNAFNNAEELQAEDNLGRLEVSTIDGDVDGDGDYDQLVSYGGRSFSIRDADGHLIFDSGDALAKITAERVPELFNSNGTVDSFDSRSNAKGIEPEGVVIGEIDGKQYAFVGLERVGGVVVYDISNPADAEFVQYINPIDEETGDALDLAPEGLQFISAKDSPNGTPMLAVSNEISGTVSVYQIDVPETEATTSEEIEFLGEVSFETGTTFENTEVGGISGLTYDADNKVFYALSDDRGTINDARYYDVAIDLSDGTLDDGDVQFTGVTTLLNAEEDPFSASSLDPEGIALTNDGNLYISSEGDANNLVDPLIGEFTIDGQITGELPVDHKFLPTADQSSGVQNNKAVESLTITPDGEYLFTATENALFQDGETSSIESGSPVRIVQYDLATGEAVGEFAYQTDAIPVAPNPVDGIADNGLVELLATDEPGQFYALERSFAEGVGTNIRIYEIDITDATDVSNIDSLDGADITAADKELLLDFDDLGIELDNSEAISFGETLPDGRQSIIVASDNNFNDIQETQFLALAIGEPTEEGDNNNSDFEPVFGTTEADELEITGSNQLVFAGDGDDLIDTSGSGGNNHIYGGRGNDIIILGNEGDDSVFASSGGDNLITGGEGADQFWITSAAISESPNSVIDFDSEDVIGIAGLGIGFEELEIVQQNGNTLISTEDNELATLIGVDSTSLGTDNFAFG